MSARNPLRQFLVGVFTLLLTPGLGSFCYGQAVAVAEIAGQVTDSSGGVIPGAEIKATQTETQFSRSTVTDAQGSYSLPGLPVGPYKLDVRAGGFKLYERTGIVLQVGNNVQINVTLEVGAISETVEVAAGATMVETKSNAVSQVIDQERIVDLPLNGRQATQLVLLSGAAVTAPAGDMTGSKSFYSSTTISVAGGQANGTNYLLDGGDNNDTMGNVNQPFPFPDALQEFNVETSSLPARNGLHPGAAVNVVTKSGSNSFHGSLFEFLRNGDVNARNFFAKEHDSLKRNQFGGTAGGRIIRDKLFFFGGYQGTRVRSDPVQSTAFVPTAAALGGDFSQLDGTRCQSNGKVRTIKDPVTGKAYTNAQVPASTFNPASLKLMQFLPTTSDPCGRVLYGIPSNYAEDQYIGRVDYTRSEKQSLFVRYFIINYNLPAFWDPKDILVTQNPGNDERMQSVNLGHTYTFTSSLVNTFHAVYSRRRDNRGPNPSDINLTNLGVNTFVGVPDDMRISVSNSFNVGCGTCAPGFFDVNTWQLADDIDYIHGRHSLALGADLIRTQNNTLTGYLQNGNVAFNGTYSGDPMLDFLQGTMSSYGQSRPQAVALRETILGLYAQDTFKLSRRLTLNAGLRWEPTMFPQDVFGRGSVFSMANFLANVHSQVYPTAPAGSLFYGDPGVPKAFTNDKWTNFSPRLGMVWNPDGNGRQTLRVGGAILYDSGMVWYSQRLMSNPPVVNEIDLTGPLSFSNPWQNYPGGVPFPPQGTVFPTGGSTFYAVLPPDLHPTRMAEWNISYERQFGNNWMASVSYMGNKTSHLWLTQDLNPALYGPGATTGNTGKRRVLSLLNPTQGTYYGQVDITDDGGNANYNGLLTSVQHRFSQGFTILANYTWSHCISDGDFNGDLRGSYYQNPFNRTADRGNCNFDYRHVFNLSFVAISPVKGNDWRGRLLGNWQLAPLLQVRSGGPVNVTSGKDNSLSGENLDRPNLVAGVPLYAPSMGPQLQWINPAAFTANPAGTFGNVGRDTLQGPGFLGLDLAFSRLFDLRENWKLEARFEAFNSLNHTNFNNPGASISSSTFGRITSAGDPRILQFAMKMHF